MTRHSPLVGALLTLLAFVGACSSGSDDPEAASGAGPNSSTVTSMPPESSSGTGVVVVGGSAHAFAVGTCQLEPDPSEPEAARSLITMRGSGTTKSGVEFTVELQRFATGTDVVTFTDTLSYADTGRIFQAQRIEVGGQVTDLREAKAATPLIRTRASGVVASGLASAPGARAKDGGLIGLAVDASC